MPSLKIAATERTPEIDFDFDSHHLRLKGESYPEDAARSTGRSLRRSTITLPGLAMAPARFDFELIYFNSSSAKAIMSLLEKLEDAAAARRIGDHQLVLRRGGRHDAGARRGVRRGR